MIKVSCSLKCLGKRVEMRFELVDQSSSCSLNKKLLKPCVREMKCDNASGSGAGGCAEMDIRGNRNDGGWVGARQKV